MASLIKLPPELISQILGFVDPKDLAQVNLTCQFLYRAQRDNIALFRTLYLRLLVSISAFIPWRFMIVNNMFSIH